VSECVCTTSPRELPKKQGTYALFVRVISPITLEVGGLKILLSPGVYAYIGSAGGTGGIRARVARHFRRYKKIHWHIDKLTTADEAVVEGVCYVPGPYGPLMEACISACMEATGFSPIPSFGASDDPFSNTHLFYVGEGTLAHESCECLMRCAKE